MNKTIKRNVVVSALLAIMLCVSLIAGATFALFTSESKVNIAVTSGKVNVVATIDDLTTYSMGNETREQGVFDNYGTASFTNEQALCLDKMTPGDRATFNVKIQNNGNVATSYRIKLYVNGDLASALIATATINDATIALSNVENVTDWTMFNGNETVTVPMVVELPLATGNEYQDKSATVTVVVEAIQGNGAGAILVDGRAYATFDEAIAAAGANGTIQISGTVKLPAVNGSNQVTDLQNVTIEGLDYATLVFVNYPGSTVSGTGTFSNMTLKNLTVVDETYYVAENGENAWEFTYLEFGGTNVFENVVFSDGIMVEAGESTFTNCTFIGHNNDSSTYGNVTMYGAWVMGGKITFKGCTFTGTRGLKVHEEYGSIESVLVDGCTFENLSEKPGVVIGIVGDDEVTIKNSTFTKTQAGDGANDPTKGVAYVYETDTKHPVLLNNNYLSVWDNNSTATAPEQSGNVYHITTAAEFVQYISNINTYCAKAAVLDCNVDLNGYVFEVSGSAPLFEGSFDGQGHTVSNYTVERTNGNYYTGLFSVYMQNKTTGNAKIMNLTVKNGTVISNGKQVAAIVPTVNVGATLDNCHAIDCTVKGVKKVGAVAGYAEGTVKNCSATNCNVYASNNDAADANVYGYNNRGTFTNNAEPDNCNTYVGCVWVSNEAELKAAVAANKATTTIILENDITVSSDWKAIDYGFYGDYKTLTNLTIDGAGHTVSGLTSALVEKVSGNCSLRILNLTVKGAVISNSSYTNGMGNGVLVGYVENGSVTLNNCHVIDCEISELSVAAAALIGYISNGTEIKMIDCSVKNTVVAGNNAAGFFGYAQYSNVTVSGCKVSGGSFTGSATNKQGAYFGTVNVGTTVNVTNTSADTIALVGRTLSTGVVNYN